MISRPGGKTLICLISLIPIFVYINGHRPGHLSPTIIGGRRHHGSHLRPVGLSNAEHAAVHGGFPRIMHQSWSNEKLPTKFVEWSNSCRSLQSDWDWVLWTDNDNLDLVQKYFPGMLAMYTGLKSNIYRADLMRYLYMYLFGGVYLDLDVECLRPFSDLFGELNLREVPWTSDSWRLNDPADHGTYIKDDVVSKCIFGQMGTDSEFEHTIPNAWMASQPRHPFFKYMIDRTAEQVEQRGHHAGVSPEALTGPIALRDGIKEFLALSSLSNSSEQIVQLPFHYIFPYSWDRDGQAFHTFCSAQSEAFDSALCKNLTAVEHWRSYTISYWSHTWTEEGRNEENVRKLTT